MSRFRPQIMKVSDLTAPELDYWVAQIEGYEVQDGYLVARSDTPCPDNKPGCCVRHFTYSKLYKWQPSQDWSQGGPIIEREGIGINPANASRTSWIAQTNAIDIHEKLGQTPLIAAMRCYVASKYEDEVKDDASTK